MCSGIPLIGDWVESIFGVRTLQEFQVTIQKCRERQGGEKPAIIILGTIPAGISVQLDFLTNLFIFHSDDEPQIELDYIRIFFGIGESQVFFLTREWFIMQPVHIMRLIIACSFELDQFIEDSQFLKERSYLISHQINKFASYINQYLSAFDQECYTEFINSVVESFNHTV